jgi:hypothetical protein
MSDDPTVIDDTTLPKTEDGTPVVRSYVTESRSGAALSIGDSFVLLFHDRAIHADVTEIETEEATDE